MMLQIIYLGKKKKRHGHVRIVGVPSNKGEGGDFGAGNHRHVSNSYRVKYQYRDGVEICVRWKEWWQDECILQDKPYQSLGRGQR